MQVVCIGCHQRIFVCVAQYCSKLRFYIQIRIISMLAQLDQYAKFIESTPSYVIAEALKVLFKRDDEFKAWLGQHPDKQNQQQIQGEALTRTT